MPFTDSGRYILNVCATCGAKFKDYASNRRKYCQRLCYEMAKQGTRHKPETIEKMIGRPAWNKDKSNPMAEVTRLKMLGRIPVNKGQRMSDEQKLKISMAKNLGKTTEALKFRMSTAYAEWRTRVFQRDH